MILHILLHKRRLLPLGTEKISRGVVVKVGWPACHLPITQHWAEGHVHTSASEHHLELEIVILAQLQVSTVLRISGSPTCGVIF